MKPTPDDEYIVTMRSGENWHVRAVEHKPVGNTHTFFDAAGTAIRSFDGNQVLSIERKKGK